MTNNTSSNALISTGNLPPEELVEKLVNEAYEENKNITEGKVADYIPALAKADPSLFGISVVSALGDVFEVGDVGFNFSIQSISKAFVYALVCNELGHEKVLERVGVNNTGLAFNSVIALELNDGHPMNPMVNAGAIATTALIPGATADEKWQYIQDGLSRFAGRRLEIDEEVYESEAKTNQRNRGIAKLLEGYERIDSHSLEMVDIYTKQCSLLVNAHDLAVMGATLADGGVNPITKESVVKPQVCRDTLAVLATSGLYERSGEWLFEIGIPGKSGVAGGIVTIAPGKGGLGTYSAPLDSAGNSVRGQRVAKYLSKRLGLNVFASQPQN